MPVARGRDAVLYQPRSGVNFETIWWHQGQSQETSMSLSLWTRGAMVPVARAAELFMRVRGIRI